MSAVTPADVVYSAQLFRCGEGLPLWEPEPTKYGAVEVGDVGYTHKGGFIRFFNAMKEKEDPINATYGVPSQKPYKSFQARDFGYNTKPNAIVAGPVCSKSIKTLMVEGGANVQAPGMTVDASVQFECMEDQGALLVLKDSATRGELLPSRRMANYMHANFNNWYQFITEDLDVDIKSDEDILFVRGWVKTKQWAVAAITHQGRSAKISLSGNFGAPAGLTFKVQAAQEMTSYFAQRSGPEDEDGDAKGKSKAPEGDNVHDTDDLPRNQCVFLHYYRYKRRRFIPLKKLEAGAGPRDPDVHSDDEGVVEPVPATPKVSTYDPVGILLDYILENEDAQAAIASDRDVVNLCQILDREIPQDFMALLREAQPQIEVNEDGLGILSFEGTAFDPTRINTQGADEPAEGEANDPDVDMDEEEKAKEISRMGGYILNTQGETNKGGVTALAYSSDGKYIASGYEDGAVVTWDPVTGRRRGNLEEHTSSVCTLEFSPDGIKLASGSSDRTIIIWNSATGIKLQELRGHEGFVHCITFSPDGKLLASSSVDFTIRIWDLENSASPQKHVLTGHTAMVMHVAFSPDGTKILSASSDCLARVWSVRTGGEIHTLEGHQGVICSVDWTPDGRRLLTSSDDGSTRIWQTESGEELVTLREHAGAVWRAAFSPDGKRVLSVAGDRMIKECDSFSGEVTLSMETNEALVDAPAFSKDGELVAAGSEDHAVHVWSTKTRMEIASFDGHTDNITHLRFAPDKTRLVSASEDSTVRIWQLPITAPPAPAPAQT
ncbi:WD40 repeat-like protein [Wolfiporia cocos MD-104 SS10]|uniref:WD40 repeat-like protein n=1 Tax=Wolfiporia cocos (strain MD-104) TaxID=742152 RepID=A0A2H3JM85_WOLCO|nr:WD40 repeat-like protein [Wolfiporia cocos MD-104 SS10]